MDRLSNLPTDLLLLILTNVTYRSAQPLRQLSHRFRAVIDERLPKPVLHHECTARLHSFLRDTPDPIVATFNNRLLRIVRRQVIAQDPLTGEQEVLVDQTCREHHHQPRAIADDIQTPHVPSSILFGNRIFLLCCCLQCPAHWVVCDLTQNSSMALFPDNAISNLHAVSPVSQNCFVYQQASSTSNALTLFKLPFDFTAGASCTLSSLSRVPFLTIEDRGEDICLGISRLCFYSAAHRLLLLASRQDTCLYRMQSDDCFTSVSADVPALQYVTTLRGSVTSLHNNWALLQNNDITKSLLHCYLLKRIPRLPECILENHRTPFGFYYFYPSRVLFDYYLLEVHAADDEHPSLAVTNVRSGSTRTIDLPAECRNMRRFSTLHVVAASSREIVVILKVKGIPASYAVLSITAAN